MDEEKRRDARVVTAILLGTVLGGALGSFGESFLNDLARDALGSRLFREESSPTVLWALDWLPWVNPCAHIGAALGCALAWRRAGKGPARPGGTRVVGTTLGWSVVGSFLGPFWALCIGIILSRFGADEVDRGGIALGTYVGPPLGALIGCWAVLRGDRGGPPSSPAGSPATRKFFSLRFSTPSRSVMGWTFVATFFLVCAGVLTPDVSPPGFPSNETSAIATLRNLTACQAQMQTSGKIDCDGDGIGEHGTFLEMTGSVPVRAGFFPGNPAGSDFSSQGKKVDPPFLSQSLANVDARGIVTKSGYCFLIYLPDTSRVAGFVHETGPAATPGLSGRVGVDLSETTWCAYAWPASRGTSGTRCFFVNQSGDVMQSANEVAKWSGMERPMAPDSAFLGGGITGRLAIGSEGRDGDVWKIMN